jgi:hypothetical protein
MEFANTDSDNRPGLSLKEKKCGHQALNQTSVAKVSSWITGVCPVLACFFITTLNINNGHCVL